MSTDTSAKQPPKKRLGRGLDGLLPAVAPKPVKASATALIEQLRPNRKQPRKRFDDEALAELAASIAEHGILEPILVRRLAGEGEGYEIIAGERRWRAAQKAGLKEVPIFVRELSDAVAFEAALVENLQREDLNAIETALAFKRLIDDFGHTQEEVAARVGKSRVAVSNFLRLLKLPEDVLALIAEDQLSEGHGRAILMASDVASMQKLARAAVARRWSVRETERHARGATRDEGGGAKGGAKTEKSANVRDLERRLSHALGAPVKLEAGKGEKGALQISYASYDELDRLIARLTRP